MTWFMNIILGLWYGEPKPRMKDAPAPQCMPRRPWHIDQRASAAAREYLGVGPHDVTPEMEKLRDTITKHYTDINAFSVKEAMLRAGFMPHDDQDAEAMIKSIAEENWQYSRREL